MFGVLNNFIKTFLFHFGIRSFLLRFLFPSFSNIFILLDQFHLNADFIISSIDFHFYLAPVELILIFLATLEFLFLKVRCLPKNFIIIEVIIFFIFFLLQVAIFCVHLSFLNFTSEEISIHLSSLNPLKFTLKTYLKFLHTPTIFFPIKLQVF